MDLIFSCTNLMRSPARVDDGGDSVRQGVVHEVRVRTSVRDDVRLARRRLLVRRVIVRAGYLVQRAFGVRMALKQV